MLDSYAQAGVSTDKAELLASSFKTLTTGEFSGSINLAGGPSLAMTIDGIGTKFLIAKQLNQYDQLGYDIVHHCINDLLCSGQQVTPIAFLDYVASSNIDVDIVQTIVKSIATACEENNMLLLGGETAEMPDVYINGAYDIVGIAIGIIDKPFTIGGVQPGSLVVGLYSSGLHTNGYSLVRNIFSEADFHKSFRGIGNLGDALLLPHHCYYATLTSLKDEPIQAIAHITGGGFTGNLARIMPEHLKIELTSAWNILPIFDLIKDKGEVTIFDMYRVFNMGIGMVLIVGKNFDMANIGRLGQVIGVVKEQ